MTLPEEPAMKPEVQQYKLSSDTYPHTPELCGCGPLVIPGGGEVSDVVIHKPEDRIGQTWVPL